MMSILQDLGMDVSDWRKYKGRYPSKNPKYCYKWAFQDNNVAVVNVWLSEVKSRRGTIYRELDLFRAKQQAIRDKASKIVSHANEMLDILQKVYESKAILRVVLCEESVPHNSTRKNVRGRVLDPAPWHVAEFNPNGVIKIVRGISQSMNVRSRHEDQFDRGDDSRTPKKKDVSGSAFVRDPKVRDAALLEAKGYCQCCDEPGFITKYGTIYLETHHIVPLSMNGSDNILNVIALCPNCHMKAHHSAECDKITDRLIRVKRKTIASSQC